MNMYFAGNISLKQNSLIRYLFPTVIKLEKEISWKIGGEGKKFKVKMAAEKVVAQRAELRGLRGW